MSNRPKINRNLLDIFALSDIVLTIWSLSVCDLGINCDNTDNTDDTDNTDNEDDDQFDDATFS